MYNTIQANLLFTDKIFLKWSILIPLIFNGRSHELYLTYELFVAPISVDIWSSRWHFEQVDFNCTSQSQVYLTLPMLRLLLSKAQECKILEKPLKPCRLGIHWKALVEYSQMSTHLPGFQ